MALPLNALNHLPASQCLHLYRGMPMLIETESATQCYSCYLNECFIWFTGINERKGTAACDSTGHGNILLKIVLCILQESSKSWFSSLAFSKILQKRLVMAGASVFGCPTWHTLKEPDFQRAGAEQVLSMLLFKDHIALQGLENQDITSKLVPSNFLAGFCTVREFR